MINTDEIVIFDTEFLAIEGSHARRWSGLEDPPPHVIQIGGLKVKFNDDLPVVEEFICYVRPRDAMGNELKLSPYIQDLTNVTQKDIDEKGIEAEEAMRLFANFAGNSVVYSYGNDMQFSMAITCFLAGLQSPVPSHQSKDIREVFAQASGLSKEQVSKASSGTISDIVGAQMPAGIRTHDARDDSYSILYALRQLIADKRLGLTHFNL